ncbi:hypothetical protein EES42_37860 [Streptomyces sp. ADI95-17]|nr:hypothetical protein EES42_37860 [Streptomyces sp. ADI95-17]
MQRVPGVLPGTAGRGLGIQDDEVQALAAQVVTGSEPCLAATDHHHVPGVCHEDVVTARASNFLRQASAT